MHEIGMVDDIIAAIKSRLKKEVKESDVKRINIAIGELEHITPSHFEFHFRERVKGGYLEGAKLSFIKVKARFKCKDCGQEFGADEGLSGCPSCKSHLNEVLEGDKIYVESIETF